MTRRADVRPRDGATWPTSEGTSGSTILARRTRVVGQQYARREERQGKVGYRRYVSGPAGVIASVPELIRAAIRYVECKSLIAGTTTSQGVTLVAVDRVMMLAAEQEEVLFAVELLGWVFRVMPRPGGLG